MQCWRRLIVSYIPRTDVGSARQAHSDFLESCDNAGHYAICRPHPTQQVNKACVRQDTECFLRSSRPIYYRRSRDPTRKFPFFTRSPAIDRWACAHPSFLSIKTLNIISRWQRRRVDGRLLVWLSPST